MLSYGDVYRHFSHIRGVKDLEMHFQTVCIFADERQPKGLYIPLAGKADINRAIENGAIAALWQKDVPVPRNIPNDFPLFAADNLAGGFLKVMQHYINQLESKDREMKTSFIFYAPDGKSEPYTYDLSAASTRQLLARAARQMEGRGRA
ncbi:hypothetical protein [Heyndrickxia acidiproducens]|uniref:hypothetical protein n=1 Tax=Heyndrickxia acidiproducens TaxID=1121084 RepID=UPI000382C6AC|nr:hypothetical protein [Heyndrickxia acidiproducens]